MSTVTQPKSVIPIGYLMMGGKKLDVSISPEFNRFFDTLVRRIGGTSGDSTDEIQSVAQEALFRASAAGVAAQAPKVTAGDGMQASPTFGGSLVSVDPEFLRILQPRPVQSDPVDEAQAIIASRVFRR